MGHTVRGDALITNIFYKYFFQLFGQCLIFLFLTILHNMCLSTETIMINHFVNSIM
jgi:hypothetical protein